MEIERVQQSVIDYVELEADTEVEEIEFKESFEHFGETSFVFYVVTADEEESEWWVIGGETPTNLYPVSQFDNPDYVFSFHQGIMSRMAERQIKEMDEPPEGEKYDAFISYSSDDKQEFVEPLVRELKRRGHLIWYDEDELEVGESIRESIDQGLSRAYTGIVVLSESFFERGWTQRELNGLVSRGVENDETIILPVWYKIEKEEVMEQSPPLADKKAVQTEGGDIKSVAKTLSQAMKSSIRSQRGRYD